MTHLDPSLRALATEAGIALGYHDIWGNHHEPSAEVVRAFLEAMGRSGTTPPGKRVDPLVPPVAIAFVGTRRDGDGGDEPHTHVVLNAPRGARVTFVLRLEGSDANGTPWQTGEVHVDALAAIEPVREPPDRQPRRLPLGPNVPMGYHELELRCGDERAVARLVVCPTRCYEPAPLAGGTRTWGLAVQLYGLTSERNWGIGDFEDLARMCEATAPLGVDVVGLNPLHPLFPHDPARTSPYSPSSRRFLNPLYIDVDAVVAEDGSDEARALVSSPSFQAGLAALRHAELVDYRGVAAHKGHALELCHRGFAADCRNPRNERERRFAAFCETQGKPLQRLALFFALSEHFAAAGPHAAPWPCWPEGLHDPDGVAARAFAERRAGRLEYHAYLQWIADEQLGHAQRRAREAGMRVGLYRDLAVGVEASSADTWDAPELYATGIRTGAPPDDFNLKGQDWGLPPPSPSALMNARLEPFIQAVRHNMRHAGALRIDHAMGLYHLFWVPPGGTAAAGAYVRYAADAMFGVVALESHRQRCLVIGEDLGTVPDEVRERIAEHGLYSYRLMWFERDAHGELRNPRDLPEAATVAAATHDIATIAGYYCGADLELRDRLDLFPSAQVRQTQHDARGDDRARLLRALRREGLLPEGLDTAAPPERLGSSLRVAAQRFLARSRAKVLMVQLEDVLGLTTQVNLPGTTDEHPNWCRKLPVPVAEWADHEDLRQTAAAIAAERPKGG